MGSAEELYNSNTKSTGVGCFALLVLVVFVEGDPIRLLVIADLLGSLGFDCLPQ
jgi:hypothetical protein